MFAAWISAAVELVDRLAPADLRASTQSLLTMSYFTLGGCLGHLLWSTTFDLYGGTRTYALAAVFSAVSVALFAFAARDHLRLEQRSRRAASPTVPVDLAPPAPLSARDKRHYKASDDNLRARSGSSDGAGHPSAPPAPRLGALLDDDDGRALSDGASVGDETSSLPRPPRLDAFPATGRPGPPGGGPARDMSTRSLQNTPPPRDGAAGLPRNTAGHPVGSLPSGVIIA